MDENGVLENPEKWFSPVAIFHLTICYSTLPRNETHYPSCYLWFQHATQNRLNAYVSSVFVAHDSLRHRTGCYLLPFLFCFLAHLFTFSMFVASNIPLPYLYVCVIKLSSVIPLNIFPKFIIHGSCDA